MSHVLLVPSREGEEQLLDSGLRGYSPPVALREPWDHLDEDMDAYLRQWHLPGQFGWIPVPEGRRLERALVLAWDGELVDEGFDRAIRMMQQQVVIVPRYMGWRMIKARGLQATYSVQWNAKLDTVLLDYPDNMKKELLPAWALATHCARRLGGEALYVP